MREGRHVGNRPTIARAHGRRASAWDGRTSRPVSVRRGAGTRSRGSGSVPPMSISKLPAVLLLTLAACQLPSWPDRGSSSGTTSDGGTTGGESCDLSASGPLSSDGVGSTGPEGSSGTSGGMGSSTVAESGSTSSGDSTGTTGDDSSTGAVECVPDWKQIGDFYACDCGGEIVDPSACNCPFDDDGCACDQFTCSTPCASFGLGGLCVCGEVAVPSEHCTG